MSSQALMSLVGLSLKQEAYRQSILGMYEALHTLKLACPGPAVQTESEKQNLLTSNVEHLRSFERAIDVYTAAGKELSEQELEPFHRPAQELMHPLLMGAPIAWRSFTKPLGYAGDYMMVNHILSEPFQGNTAFDQLLSFSLLLVDVAQGHRNRIVVLQGRLTEYAERARAEGKTLRVLTIGCGPAEETFRFIRDYAHPKVLDISLLDFSRETLDWSKHRIEQLCLETGKSAKVTCIEDSVYNLAKKKPDTPHETYDLVICAGLFDYLTDRFCKRVMEFGVRSLLPGGTLLVTNVSSCRDSFFMSKMLEWDLIYRTADELAALLPQGENLKHNVYVESTGTNVVAEIALSEEVTV